MRPDRFFLGAGLLYGLLFLVATPPFQVPDEPAHFYRAFALTEGEPWATRGAQGLGAVLPASVAEVGDGLRGDLPFVPGRKIRPATILRAFRVPLEEERRRFTDFRTAAVYTLVPYLPQAAGIAAARLFGAPVLGLLYAARLANLLAATALIALGLRQLPAYPWLFTRQLGWLDVNLPKPLLWGYAALLGLLALFDARSTVTVSPGQRVLLVFVTLAVLALVSASQYAVWTPYGADFLEGIQGRYFLPLGPAAAWILHTRRLSADPARLGRVLPWVSLVCLGVALWSVIQRYYYGASS
jgi:hypothetical protein